jgi:hypothetical protein
MSQIDPRIWYRVTFIRLRSSRGRRLTRKACATSSEACRRELRNRDVIVRLSRSQHGCSSVASTAVSRPVACMQQTLNADQSDRAPLRCIVMRRGMSTNGNFLPSPHPQGLAIGHSSAMRTIPEVSRVEKPHHPRTSLRFWARIVVVHGMSIPGVTSYCPDRCKLPCMQVVHKHYSRNFRIYTTGLSLGFLPRDPFTGIVWW